MAVAGPLARTIADLRLALGAMAQGDARDPWWTPAPLALGEFRKRAALSIAPEGLATTPEVAAALQDAARRLRDAGWEVVETECPSLRRPATVQLVLWLAEYGKAGVQAVHDEGDPDASFVFAQYSALAPAPDLDAMLEALRTRLACVREWALFFEEFPLLLCPVSAERPFPDQLDVESPAAFRRCFDGLLTQFALPTLGLPGLTVSTGTVAGVPVGVMLVAGRFREDVLLEAGEAIERGGVPATPIDPR
jgi:amidase